ncbi:MAG TPA: hypothetical protein VFA55_00255, partial [Candidatus Kapabacteria bacterium]|nr:hypothetical protein [Candidatus Kapabacteria bacterium]
MKHTILFAVSALLLFFSSSAFAQYTEFISTQNKYVKANVLLASGQLQITTPDGLALSYYGGSGQWNSYTTFRMHIAGSDVYYTNMTRKSPNDLGNGIVGGSESQLHLADTTYKIDDTIRTIWQNGPRGTTDQSMNGFRVTQNIWPVLTPGGGLIMIQYIVTSLDSIQSSSNACLGVMLVLDNDVYHGGQPADACNGQSEPDDNPRILTSLKYDAVPQGGSINPCWIGNEDVYISRTGIPEWYLAGLRFPDYNANGTTLLGKGVLKGPGLVPPDTFYVGDWGSTIAGFKDSAWDFDSVVIPGNSINDAATGYKWSMNVVNGYSKTVATAYGTNDFTGNYAICNNGPLMTLVKVSPLDHRRNPNGVFDSLNTRVDVYLANVDHSQNEPQSVNVHLDLTNAPYFVGPASDSLPIQVGLENNSSNIGQEFVGHAFWNLAVDTTLTHVNQDYVNTLSFNISNRNLPAFNVTCPNPVTITYHAYQKDVTPPQIVVYYQSKDTSDWIVSDDQNFYDTGLDSIVVISDTNYKYTPVTFSKCDPTQGAHVFVSVIDTAKNASFKFRVVDCSGNSTLGSVSYAAPVNAVIEPIALPAGINVIN